MTHPTPVPSSPDLQREAQEYATQEVGPKSSVTMFEWNALRDGYLAAATPREAQLTIAREALEKIRDRPGMMICEIQSIAVEALKKMV